MALTMPDRIRVRLSKSPWSSVVELVGELLERVGDGRVEDRLRPVDRSGRADRAELELVAGEGERRGPVAVRGVGGQDRQRRHPELEIVAVLRRGGRSLFELADDVDQLGAQEDRHDRRRRLVGAQPVVVARVGDARPEQVGMDVDAADDGQQEREELGVGVRVVARVEEVLAVVRGHRPVVVLARAVDPRERLLVDQEHQAVMLRDAAHQAHDDHVVVRADRGGLVDRRHLELAGRDLVVAGLGRDAEAPQLAVDVHHEGEDPLADRAEVLVLQLLALGRRGTEQGPPGQQQVRPLLGQPPVDQEVLLLRPDVGEDPLGRRVVEPAEDPQRLRAERLLGPQERDLEVERLAGIGDVGGRDRQRDPVRLDLQEDRAGDVPAGVAAGLEGRAQAAGRERARVGLALEQVAAGELGDRLAVAGRGQERVVLLRRGAGHRHEPVGVVGRAVGERPLLHAVRDGVHDGRIERLVALDRLAELAEDRLGEVVALGALVEDVLAVDVGAGVLEVALRLLDPVTGDLRDGGLSGGHGSPDGCRALL